MAAGLAAGPVAVVALLWLGHSGHFGTPIPSPTDVGSRTRPSVAARGVTNLVRLQPGGCPVRGDCVLDFPYRDGQLLAQRQTHGGRVWIPAVARARGGRYPLVVLLHGTTSEEPGPEPPHTLLAPPLDLSRAFKRAVDQGTAGPMLVAAPSQSRNAQDSPSLWTGEGFDLADFVAVLDAELEAVSGVQVDHRFVSVLGHSGAGCVVTPREQNGLFRVARRASALQKKGLRVVLLGLMDICFHGYGGGRFLRDALSGTATHVAAMWVEPQTWFTSLHRDLDGFASGLGTRDPVACDKTLFESCLGNAQGWWLLQARRQVLQRSLDSAATAGRQTVHAAVTRWFVQELLRRNFMRKNGG